MAPPFRTDVYLMSFDEKSEWQRQNAVTAARHFQYRLDTFFHLFLKSDAHSLAELVDNPVRIPSKRVSTHTPFFGSRMHRSWRGTFLHRPVCQLHCSWKWRFGSVSFESQEASTLLYMRRNGPCHFHYPQPPSPKTVIARQILIKNLLRLSKLPSKNVLNDTYTPADISLEELLNSTNVFHNM